MVEKRKTTDSNIRKMEKDETV
jgi:hypothetical protein